MGLRGFGSSHANRQKRGERLAPTIRFKARPQVIQDVASLLTAGRYYGEHSLHEPASFPTIGPPVTATVLGDGEDREEGSHRRPQPDLATILAPRRLVDVHHFGLMDRSREFVVGGFQGCGRLPFQFGDHPGGDRERKQVRGDLLDLSLAETVDAREHGQHGLEIRTKASGRDAGGQGATGGLAAVGTDQAMEPILIDDRLNLGQFGDLMDQRLGVIAGKAMTTAATVGRLAVKRLANFLGRYSTSAKLAMSGLSAAFLSAGRSGGFALHSDGIGRGRLGRVGRVKLEAVFQIIEPALKQSEALFVGFNERKNRRLQFGRGCLPQRFWERRRCHSGKVMVSFGIDNPRP